VILSEMESMIQLIRHNADKLCTSTLEKILRIISERKSLRKAYADERANFDQKLAQVSKHISVFCIAFDMIITSFVKLLWLNYN